MSVLKRVCLIFLLVDLTLGIIFLPQLFSGQNEEALLQKSISRTYTAGNRPKLTGEEVARLYYNCEISIGYNMLDVTEKEAEEFGLFENALEAVSHVYPESHSAYGIIKNTLDAATPSFFRNSVLVKIDDQPTALNFVLMQLKEDNVFFEILYEEKTKTVICLSFNFSNMKFGWETDFGDLINESESLARAYYEQTLSLDSDTHYEYSVLYYYRESEECIYADGSVALGLLQITDKNIAEDFIIEKIKYTK